MAMMDNMSEDQMMDRMQMLSNMEQDGELDAAGREELAMLRERM